VHRALTDWLLVGIIRAAPVFLGVPLVQRLFPLVTTVLVGLLWPLLAVGDRARLSGHRVSPWAWGRQMGEGFCDLFGRARSLRVCGELPHPDSSSLVLAAHLGPWEAGAVELARLGHRPMVLAAPWPRLPLAAQALRARRARLGVATAFRSTRGWREATEHLRDGGMVVALVDSLSPQRRGRRSVDFVGGQVGAPDALVAWAERQSASMVVALGSPNGFRLCSLEEPREEECLDSDGRVLSQVQVRADRCVSMLKEAVEAHPSSWAWVRALALFVLGFPLLTVSACGVTELTPPLPSAPSDWLVTADDLLWAGELNLAVRARLVALRGEGEWREERPYGLLEGVSVDLWSVDTGLHLAAVEAATGRGSWPQGPTVFSDVSWHLVASNERGSLPEISWSRQGGWSCEGCPLESLVQ